MNLAVVKFYFLYLVFSVFSYWMLVSTIDIISLRTHSLNSIKKFNSHVRIIDENPSEINLSSFINMIVSDDFEYPRPHNRYNFDIVTESHIIYLEYSLALIYNELIKNNDNMNFEKSFIKILSNIDYQISDLNMNFIRHNKDGDFLSSYAFSFEIDKNTVEYFCSLVNIRIYYESAIKLHNISINIDNKFKFYYKFYGFCM